MFYYEASQLAEFEMFFWFTFWREFAIAKHIQRETKRVNAQTFMQWQFDAGTIAGLPNFPGC